MIRCRCDASGSERRCRDLEQAAALALGDTEPFMRQAIALAEQAVAHGNHPFGALLVKDGAVLLTAENTVHTEHDATRHAEMISSVRRRQFDLKTLAASVLYTSTEPCAMCRCNFMGGIGTMVYCSAETLGAFTGSKFVVPSRACMRGRCAASPLSAPCWKKKQPPPTAPIEYTHAVAGNRQCNKRLLIPSPG